MKLSILKWLLLTGGMTLQSIPAWAQSNSQSSYPTKPVSIVLPYVAGAASDIEVRYYLPSLMENLKQPFVINYKPGAATRIGNAYVAKAAPDGYTLLFVTAAFPLSAIVAKDSPYDPIKDFAPISMLTDYLNVVSVSNSLPVKTLAELVAYARGNPGKLNHATLGFGGASQIAGAWLYSLAGVKVTYVSYKGTPEVWTDMMRGNAHVMITGPLGTGPLAKAGKIRAIAVTSQDRSPYFPGVPAVKETYPEYFYAQWSGFVAPARTPPAIIDRLSLELGKAARAPDVEPRLVADARNILASTPEYFRKRLQDEVVMLRRVVSGLDIQSE